jgi:hypothetical protein
VKDAHVGLDARLTTACRAPKPNLIELHHVVASFDFVLQFDLRDPRILFAVGTGWLWYVHRRRNP